MAKRLGSGPAWVTGTGDSEPPGRFPGLSVRHRRATDSRFRGEATSVGLERWWQRGWGRKGHLRFSGGGSGVGRPEPLYGHGLSSHRGRARSRPYLPRAVASSKICFWPLQPPLRRSTLGGWLSTRVAEKWPSPSARTAPYPAIPGYGGIFVTGCAFGGVCVCPRARVPEL